MRKSVCGGVAHKLAFYELQNEPLNDVVSWYRIFSMCGRRDFCIVYRVLRKELPVKCFIERELDFSCFVFEHPRVVKCRVKLSQNACILS